MKLYELTAEYQAFLLAIENDDIPEEAITDTLESIVTAIEEKADNIACIIKSLTAEVEAIKAEKKRLSDRIEAKEKRVKQLESYLANTIIAAGIDNIETARNKLTFRKSERVVIDNESAFVEWAKEHNDSLLTYKQPEISKKAVKEVLSSGVILDGARIENCMNLQIK